MRSVDLAYRRYCRCRERGPKGQAGYVAGNVREPLDVACIVPAAAHAGWFCENRVKTVHSLTWQVKAS